MTKLLTNSQIIVKNGKPQAVIVNIKLLKRLLELLEDVEDLAELKSLRRKKLHFRHLEEILSA
jgi:3-methyladenine DNA glycosylase Tag